MRNIIPIIAAIALAGCHTPQAVDKQPAPMAITPPPFPMLITNFCAYAPPDRSRCWWIDVSEDSINMRGMGFTPDSHAWTAEPGWFVFSENESRVWAYDGSNMLYLAAFHPSTEAATNTATISGAAFYPATVQATDFASNFPCALPPEVTSHLPQQKQK